MHVSINSSSSFLFCCVQREDLKDYNPVYEDGVWKCPICGPGKTMANRSHMTRHIKMVHLHRRPWTCGSCGTTFEKLKGLQRHVEGVHGRKKLLREESRYLSNQSSNNSFF